MKMDLREMPLGGARTPPPRPSEPSAANHTSEPRPQSATPLTTTAASRPDPFGGQRVPAALEGSLRRRSRGGVPLPPEVGSQMESRFGADLSTVRIHSDAEASGLAGDLGAKAFTYGSDLYFRSGAYRPTTSEGQHTLAHELAHVLTTPEAPSASNALEIGRADDPLERQADQLAEAALDDRLPAGSRVVQHAPGVIRRMVLPLDDLERLLASNPQASAAARASAQVITDAVGRRVGATGESIVSADQVQGSIAAPEGALAALGLEEELRIFGHGQTTTVSNNEAVQVGGYRPERLAAVLIAMGLSRHYVGEIYISGCLTAVGAGHGFLGKFYAQIKKHAPNCTVRGNLGEAVTLPDGTQAVWSGETTEESYQQQMAAFAEMAKKLTQDRAKAEARATNAWSHKVREQGKAELADCVAVTRSFLISRDNYWRTLYDTTQAWTIRLPDESVRMEGVVDTLVSGAVMSSAEVAALINQVTDVEPMQRALDPVLSALEAEASDLVSRTETLGQAPLSFAGKGSRGGY